MKKLTLIQIISVSMMLFAIFFGAGNMIFPPAMGQLAGTSYISALAGFILTDACNVFCETPIQDSAL